MISATVRACALLPVLRSRTRSPAALRLRLALKVAKRTSRSLLGGVAMALRAERVSAPAARVRAIWAAYRRVIGRLILRR